MDMNESKSNVKIPSVSDTDRVLKDTFAPGVCNLTLKYLANSVKNYLIRHSILT